MSCHTRSSGCRHGPRDNTSNLVHSITPPSIDIGVPYSAFYYLSPCSYSYQSSRADQGAEFLSGGEASLLCCFISCTRMKRAWGKKTMLSALTHLTARHRGTGRGERIFYLTLSLSVGTSGRPRLLWHTWWSAALHMIMTALARLVHVLQGDRVFTIAVRSSLLLPCFQSSFNAARARWYWPRSHGGVFFFPLTPQPARGAQTS